MHTRRYTVLAVALVSLACLLLAAASTAQALTAQEKVGRSLFFDAALSDPAGKDCAACHAVKSDGPAPMSRSTRRAQYTGVQSPVASATASRPRRPTPATAPCLSTTARGDWVGGMFWDGRATGADAWRPAGRAGSGPVPQPARAEQRQRPGGRGQGRRTRATPACSRRSGVKASSATPALPTRAIARSIAAFERSPQVSSVLVEIRRLPRRPGALTAQEADGLALFEGKANCSDCHSSAQADGVPPLFTDFTYDNLGVPKNPPNPFYTSPRRTRRAADWVDTGLGGFLKGAGYDTYVYEPELGKFKVPTLRNVDKRPSPASSRPTGTTATSRASRRSSTSTTRATSPVPGGGVCLGRQLNTQPT